MTMTNRWFMRAGLMTTMMLGGWSGCTVVTVEVSTQGEEGSAEGGAADSQGSAEASGDILTTSGTSSGYEPGGDAQVTSGTGEPGDSDFGTESTDGEPGDSDFGTGSTGQAPDDGETQGSTGSSSSGAGNDSEGSSG